MNVAIIGVGNIGATVATNLIAGGQAVTVVDRGDGKAKAIAEQSNGKAKAGTINEALKAADVIILAIYFDGIKGFVAEHSAELKGKVIVDPSNPIAPDGKGGFTKTIGTNESSGEVIAALLPTDAKLVKAFGTLGADSLKSAANQSPDKAVLFYAADDKSAGDTVAALIKVSGFEPVSVGGIDQSIRLEVFGELHQFGALGKTVTAAEAQKLLKS